MNVSGQLKPHESEIAVHIDSSKQIRFDFLSIRDTATHIECQYVAFLHTALEVVARAAGVECNGFRDRQIVVAVDHVAA
jgi:hypothetical protein